MLKLEKAAYNQSITVSLRHEESIFNRLFIKSFLLAVTLHFGGLFLFEVHLIHKEDVMRFAVEVSHLVDSNLGYSNFPMIGIHKFSEERGFSVRSRGHQTPYHSLPTIPSYGENSIENRFCLQEELLAYEVPKVQFERVTYDPKPIEFPFPEERKLVSLSISGALSAKKILEDGLKGLSFPESVKKGLKFAYEVRVSDQSGKILWFSKMEGSAVFEEEKLMESMLQAMLFEKLIGSLEEPSITGGVVEVVFD